MKLYPNVIEWGPGVYGAEAATQPKPAAALTEVEAVRLAAVIPDPLDWSPRRPSRRVLARSTWIESNMAALPTARPLPCGRARPYPLSASAKQAAGAGDALLKSLHPDSGSGSFYSLTVTPFLC